MKIIFKDVPFVPEHKLLIVNNNTHRLLKDSNISYEEQAVNLLKNKYHLDYNIKDIKFD